MVIIGISIAFQLEAWGESRREAEIHQTMLNGLRSELELNVAEIESLSSRREATIAAGQELRDLYAAASPESPPDVAELTRLIAFFASASTPDIQIAQLEAYVGSSLDVTREHRPRLLRLLTCLQTLNDQGEFYFSYRLRAPLEVLLPNFDISRQSLLDPEAVFNTRFLNTMLLATAAESDQLRLETECLESLRQALETI